MSFISRAPFFWIKDSHACMFAVLTSKNSVPSFVVIFIDLSVRSFLQQPQMLLQVLLCLHYLIDICYLLVLVPVLLL